ERLADAVVGRTVERDARLHDTPKRIGERLAVRVADGSVVEAGVPGRRRRAALRLPRVQTDVVVVAAGGDERCLVAHPRLFLEAENAAGEGESPGESGALQVHVAV